MFTRVLFDVTMLTSTFNDEYLNLTNRTPSLTCGILLVRFNSPLKAVFYYLSQLL